MSAVITITMLLSNWYVRGNGALGDKQGTDPGVSYQYSQDIRVVLAGLTTIIVSCFIVFPCTSFFM